MAMLDPCLTSFSTEFVTRQKQDELMPVFMLIQILNPAHFVFLPAAWCRATSCTERATFLCYSFRVKVEVQALTCSPSTWVSTLSHYWLWNREWSFIPTDLKTDLHLCISNPDFALPTYSSSLEWGHEATVCPLGHLSLGSIRPHSCVLAVNCPITPAMAQDLLCCHYPTYAGSQGLHNPRVCQKEDKNLSVGSMAVFETREASTLFWFLNVPGI